MIGFEKSSTVARQSSYDSLYLNNPLTEIKHNRSSCEGGEHVANLGLQLCRSKSVVACGKENDIPVDGRRSWRRTLSNFPVEDRVLKPSSLQTCVQKNEPDSTVGSKIRGNGYSKPENARDFSDSEAAPAPASSWGTLPNRFIPTGSFRSMRAWILKYQSMQLKSTCQIRHLNGLPS